MNRFVLPAAALGTVLLIGACGYQQGGYASPAAGYVSARQAAYPPGPYNPALDRPRSPRATADLIARLGGRIVGPPQSCLPSRRAGNMHVVDEYTVLYRDGATIWRNDPPGGCNGLGRSGSAMVSRTIGAQLCRGDIVQIVDNTSGFNSGSCVLGDFVPFRHPRA